METMSAGGSAISITQLLSFQSHDDFKVIFLGNPYITLRFLFSISIVLLFGYTDCLLQCKQQMIDNKKYIKGWIFIYL